MDGDRGRGDSLELLFSAAADGETVNGAESLRVGKPCLYSGLTPDARFLELLKAQ